MCGAVRNKHQCFDLVELIVALLCIPDSAAHTRGLQNLAETCDGSVQPYLRSIGACISVHDWHQCFDLAELVVALFCISNSAAHICGLGYFEYLYIYRVLECAQACMTNSTLISVADPTGDRP